MLINGRPVKLLYDSEQCIPYIPFAKSKLAILISQPAPILTQRFLVDGDVNITIDKGTICTIDIRIDPSEYLDGGYEVSEDWLTATKGKRSSRSPRAPYKHTNTFDGTYIGNGLMVSGSGDLGTQQYKWPPNPGLGQDFVTLADGGLGWATLSMVPASSKEGAEPTVVAAQVPIGVFAMFVSVPSLPSAVLKTRMTHQYADAFSLRFEPIFVASDPNDPDETVEDRMRLLVPALTLGGTDAYSVPLFRPGVSIVSKKAVVTHTFSFGAGNHFHSPYIFVFTPDTFCVFAPALSPKGVDAGVFTAVTTDGGATFTEYSHANLRAALPGEMTTSSSYGTQLNRNIMELVAMAFSSMVVISPTEMVGITYIHDYDGIPGWFRVYTNDCGASFSITPVTGFDLLSPVETMIEWVRYIGGDYLMLRASHMSYENMDYTYEATQWPSRYFYSTDKGATWHYMANPGDVDVRADLGDALPDGRGDGRVRAVSSAVVWEPDPKTGINRRVYRAFHIELTDPANGPLSNNWQKGGLIYDRFVEATYGSYINVSTGEPVLRWVFCGAFGLSNGITYEEDSGNWGNVRLRKLHNQWAAYNSAAPWQHDAAYPPPEKTP